MTHQRNQDIWLDYISSDLGYCIGTPVQEEGIISSEYKIDIVDTE